jgi:hypothetical protein
MLSRCVVSHPAFPFLIIGSVALLLEGSLQRHTRDPEHPPVWFAAFNPDYYTDRGQKWFWLRTAYMVVGPVLAIVWCFSILANC